MAPDRMVVVSLRFKPVLMGCPKPPAPANAATVAVPTATTALVRMPARIERAASGSSTKVSRSRSVSPSTMADSRSAGGMSTRPWCALVTMGSSP